MPTNTLTVGFRILWKITVMFTLPQQTPTNTDWTCQSGKKQTPTNCNIHWQLKNPTKVFVDICLCCVNWPLYALLTLMFGLIFYFFLNKASDAKVPLRQVTWRGSHLWNASSAFKSSSYLLEWGNKVLQNGLQSMLLNFIFDISKEIWQQPVS